MTFFYKYRFTVSPFNSSKVNNAEVLHIKLQTYTLVLVRFLSTL